MSENDTLLSSETDWERLENMSDEDIDLSDIPELTEEDFKKAKPTREFFAERGMEFDPGGPHTITIHHEDGTTTTREYIPPKGIVVLDPDVRAYFPDSESVNRTLRSLIALIPEKE